MKGLSELARSRASPRRWWASRWSSTCSSPPDPVIDYRSLQKADGTKARVFTTELIKRGVVKNTQKMYMSPAHTDADVAKTLKAFEDALKVLRREALAGVRSYIPTLSECKT